jgi:hypothetical protein
MEKEEARLTRRFGGGGSGGSASSDLQLRSLSDRHQKLLSKFTILQKTHDSTKIMFVKRDEELVKWKAKFAMAQQVIRRQEHEHAKSLDSLRLEVEERRATLVQEHIESEERLSKMLELSKEEIERYSREVSNSQESSRRLERELAGVRAECDASHRNHKEAKEKIQTFEEQCTNYSREVRSLKDTLLGERSSKASMSVRLASAEDQVHEMDESLTAVQKELLNEKEWMVQENDRQSRFTARMGEWICAIVRLTRVMLKGVSHTLSWNMTSWQHSVMHVLEGLVGSRLSSERLFSEREEEAEAEGVCDDSKTLFSQVSEDEMEGAWREVIAVARDELADLVLMEENREEEEGAKEEDGTGKKKDWMTEVLDDLESIFSLQVALRTWRDEIYDDLLVSDASTSSHLAGGTSIVGTEDHHDHHNEQHKEKEVEPVDQQPTSIESLETEKEEIDATNGGDLSPRKS